MAGTQLDGAVRGAVHRDPRGRAHRLHPHRGLRLRGRARDRAADPRARATARGGLSDPRVRTARIAPGGRVPGPAHLLRDQPRGRRRRLARARGRRAVRRPDRHSPRRCCSSPRSSSPGWSGRRSSRGSIGSRPDGSSPSLYAVECCLFLVLAAIVHRCRGGAADRARLPRRDDRVRRADDHPLGHRLDARAPRPDARRARRPSTSRSRRR